MLLEVTDLSHQKRQKMLNTQLRKENDMRQRYLRNLIFGR